MFIAPAFVGSESNAGYCFKAAMGKGKASTPTIWTVESPYIRRPRVGCTGYGPLRAASDRQRCIGRGRGHDVESESLRITVSYSCAQEELQHGNGADLSVPLRLLCTLEIGNSGRWWWWVELRSARAVATAHV